MLGIESEISVQGEVTSLSIMSQQNTQDKVKNLSTNKSSTLDGEECPPVHTEENLRADKIRILRSKLVEIEKKQNLFEHKMKNCVGIIEKEVEKKEEKNRELQQLIKNLKEQLTQSTSDIEVLSNYILKKKADANVTNKTRKYSPQSSATISSTNSNPQKNDKNAKIPEKTHGMKSNSPKAQRQLKTNSPANKGLSSQSPKGRAQLGQKSSSPGAFVSSPFKRKIKGILK